MNDQTIATMTKEELAAKLDGIEYYQSIPEEYYPALVENNLAVVTVGGDDECHFIYPENGEVKVKEKELFSEHNTFWFDKGLKKILDVFDQINSGWKDEDCKNSLEAEWMNEEMAPDGEPFLWTFKTRIPRATFNVVVHDFNITMLSHDEARYDGKKVLYHSRSIIFNINDLI